MSELQNNKKTVSFRKMGSFFCIQSVEFIETPKNFVYGSTVQSDAYRSYRKPLAESYLHEYQVFDSSDCMLHWLHTIVANVKAFVVETYHGLGVKQLQVYLDEFCYHFNRRFRQGELFDRLLFAISKSMPLRFAELT